MGIVYLAESADKTPVAIKVIRSELAGDPEFRKRFRQEVEAAWRVSGAFTAKVLDADPEAVEPYLVTEYIPGPTLGDHILSNGPLDESLLVAFAVSLAEALHAIHMKGLVHRDLKPSNVILTEGGPRVIDFGIARAVDATSITRTGITLGTPAWMAPEQAKGQKSGPPADIFSWALLVGYAASGAPPFGEGPSDSVLYRIVHEEPVLTDLPTRLLPTISAALSKDVSARPSASDVLTALLDQVPAGTSVTEAATSFIDRTWVLKPDGAAVEPLIKRSKRLWRPVALTSLVVVVLVAGGAFGRNFLMEDVPSPNQLPSSADSSTSPANERAETDEDSPEEGPSPEVTPSPTERPFNREVVFQRATNRVRSLGYEPMEASVSDVSKRLWAMRGSNADATVAGGTNYDHRIFFFLGRRYLGTDTAEPNALLPDIVNQQPFTVTIYYYLYEEADPFCCPTGGFALVRFHWDGQQLTPLDPIPANRSPNLGD